MGLFAAKTRNKKRAAALSEVKKQKATGLFVDLCATRVSTNTIINLVKFNHVVKIFYKIQKVPMNPSFPLNSNLCPLERQIWLIVVSC